MHGLLSRRDVLLALAAPRPLMIDTHIHLFDPARFPYHSSGTYKPPASPLEPYLDFAQQAGIAHTIIVHPEPYQDDHRYLAYCFDHERPRGLFKGTILLDPLDPATPKRMAELVKQHQGRIVAMRIHAMNAPGEPPVRTGPIKNRDLRDPAMKAVWKKAGDLGIGIQMHFLPHHAPEIGALAAEFPNVPVILDHMGRAGQGKPEDVDAVIALAKHRRVYFKFSGWSYTKNAKPVVQRAFREYGADRILWGGLGHDMKQHAAARKIFDEMFDFATEADRDKIRGLNAAKLFRFA